MTQVEVALRDSDSWRWGRRREDDGANPEPTGVKREFALAEVVVNMHPMYSCAETNLIWAFIAAFAAAAPICCAMLCIGDVLTGAGLL